MVWWFMPKISALMRLKESYGLSQSEEQHETVSLKMLFLLVVASSILTGKVRI